MRDVALSIDNMENHDEIVEMTKSIDAVDGQQQPLSSKR